MRAKDPNHYPYTLGMALNRYKLKSKVSICFRLQSGLENWHFSANKNREGCVVKKRPLEYLHFYQIKKIYTKYYYFNISALLEYLHFYQIN